MEHIKITMSSKSFTLVIHDALILIHNKREKRKINMHIDQELPNLQ